MKRIFLFIVCCVTLFSGLRAQEDSKYLLGAVPIREDGLVHFKTTLKAPALTQLEMYNIMKDWASNYFQPKEEDKGLFNPRVLFYEEDKGTIVANGEEYMTFNSSFISLDRTRFYYHLLIQCKDGECDLDLTNIRYLYNDGSDGGSKYTAEEWISDKYAVRKSGTKLVPISGKFRKKTIDTQEEIFKSAQNALGDYLIKLGANITKTQTPEPVVVQVPVTEQKPETVQKPVTEQKPVTVVQEEKPVAPVVQSTEKAPARIMISANGEEIKIDEEAWGGYGEMFGKKVAFIVLDTRKAMANLLLSSNEDFTISFYKEGENKPSEVVQCKRLMQQQNIKAEEAAKINAGNKDANGSYNMYVGEIIR